MTPDASAALLRRLATNRDTFTEWVITRAQTQDILDLVAETRRVALEEAATVAGYDSMLDWVGGSTGNAKGTALRIAESIRARAQEAATGPMNPNDFNRVDADPYLHTTLHGVKVKVLLDEDR